MPRSADSKSRPSAVLLIFLFLALAGSWTWRLWPRTAAEPDESLRLQSLKEVAAYLSRAPASVVKPILMSLAGVSDSHLAVLKDWVGKASAQQLRELTVQEHLTLAGDVRDALLLAWLGQEEKAPLMESYLMIAASGDRLSADVKAFALEQLAREAITTGQKALAVTILERAVRLPQAKWDTLGQLVEACRSAGDYNAAVAGVRGWMKQHLPHEAPARLDQARDLEVTLMLEAGRADEALSGQLEILQSSPPDLLPVAVLDRARVCASAAKQMQRMTPWLEKHLDNFREAGVEWHGLLRLQDVDPEYRRWLTHLAGIADEQGVAKRSFNLYLRLAACGEKNALPRLCALAVPAGSEEECRRFLGKALEHPLLLAAVLEVAQDEPLAARVVAGRLRERPHDRDLHFAAALAEAAAKPTGNSAMVWQNFLRRFPKDAAGKRRLIECHLAARQPAMARRVMETMDANSLTDYDRRQREVLKQL